MRLQERYEEIERRNGARCARKMQIKKLNSVGMKVEEPKIEPAPMIGARRVSLGPNPKTTRVGFFLFYVRVRGLVKATQRETFILLKRIPI